ncbi:MAG: hypothetical protein Q8Q85_10920, partial [Gemmatimonadales bacterium]|nr:hypothetical protein [Gemmatimonadales bacterium]
MATAAAAPDLPTTLLPGTIVSAEVAGASARLVQRIEAAQTRVETVQKVGAETIRTTEHRAEELDAHAAELRLRRQLILTGQQARGDLLGLAAAWLAVATSFFMAVWRRRHARPNPPPLAGGSGTAPGGDEAFIQGVSAQQRQAARDQQRHHDWRIDPRRARTADAVYRTWRTALTEAGPNAVLILRAHDLAERAGVTAFRLLSVVHPVSARLRAEGHLPVRLATAGESMRMAWARRRGREPRRSVVPDSRYRAVNTWIERVMTGGPMPSTYFAPRLAADGHHELYRFGTKAVRLFVGTGEGRVWAEDEMFADGTRGFIYWLKLDAPGQEDIPLVGYGLFKDGQFLKRPVRQPFGRSDLPGHFGRVSARALRDQYLLHYLLTGFQVPEPQLVHLDNRGRDYLFSVNGHGVAVSTAMQWRHQPVLREAVEFAQGVRGVRYWAAPEGRKAFPLASVALTRRGHVVSSPQSSMRWYDARRFANRDLPQPRKLPLAHLVTFLLSGHAPPPDVFAPLDRLGMERLYLVGRHDIRLSIGKRYHGRGEIVRRPWTAPNGDRGVMYVRQQPETPELSVVAYALFHDGAFLTSPVRYLFGLSVEYEANWPNADREEVIELLYFLASGQRMPAMAPVRLDSSGNDILYWVRKHPVYPYVSEALGKHTLLREAVEFSPGTRGVRYWTR